MLTKQKRVRTQGKIVEKKKPGRKGQPFSQRQKKPRIPQKPNGSVIEMGNAALNIHRLTMKQLRQKRKQMLGEE